MVSDYAFAFNVSVLADDVRSIVTCYYCDVRGVLRRTTSYLLLIWCDVQSSVQFNEIFDGLKITQPRCNSRSQVLAQRGVWCPDYTAGRFFWQRTGTLYSFYGAADTAVCVRVVKYEPRFNFSPWNLCRRSVDGTRLTKMHLSGAHAH